MKSFLQVAIPLLVAWSLYRQLRSRGTLKKSFNLYKKLRIRHFGAALVALPLVLLTAASLWAYAPPLRWSWWSLLSSSGTMNTGTSDATSSGFLRIIPIFVLGAIILLIPVLAEQEEKMAYCGRRGSENRSIAERVKAAIGFGLMHTLVGIPIALALGLAVGGLAFTYMYMREYKKRLNMGISSFEVIHEKEKILAHVTAWDVNGDMTATYDVNTPTGTETYVVEGSIKEAVQQFAIRESTLTHSAYNLMIFTVALAALLL